MKFTVRLAALGSVALAAAGLALPATSAQAASGGSGHTQTVFVQTDGLAGNAVVVYDRLTDGSLRRAGSYRTGGLGGALVGSVVDHLASQGSLTFDPYRRLLYAVNAGSNTITVFGLSGDRLIRRQVIASGGTFPVSVAARGHLVYVLNARQGGSVQGFAWHSGRLHLVSGWHRNLTLPTADPEFTHTPGQVLLTPDATKLLVTTKATSNSVDVFAINRAGAPSAAPVVNPLPGAAPFAGVFDRRGDLAVAEVGTGAVATFRVSSGGHLVSRASAATGQAATCWISAAGNRLYASNAGSASVSGFGDRGPRGLRSLGNTATDAGTVDSTVSSDGRFLYVQTGAAGIVDAFRIHADGSLSRLGSVAVPGAIGGEGIAAS
jgi:DNA-binding beta-propeller fold protein YncE